MAEGMPYYKPHKSPVENSDESLEDIEKQASLLFEEFLRLAPVPSAGSKRYASFEQSDYFGVAESCEADEDDMVPDSEIITKGASAPPLPGEPWQSSADPAIQRLALQMQKAGDALYNQYEGKVESTQNHLVSFVLSNAAHLTYERLSKEIDNMVGRDRSWSNFVLAYSVGRRVVMETSKACSTVSEYFSRYVSQSYSPAIQQAGGMAPFVNSRGRKQ